jgi:hypothetical protein
MVPDKCLVYHLALSRSAHRLDQVSWSFSPRRWGQLGRRGSQASPGLVGWGLEGRSGGISRSGRASTASIVRWPWCSAAGRSGIGSSRDQSLRARAVGIHKWSDVLERRRIRRELRRELAREPGRRTSVARGRRRAREVRQPPSHDRSRETAPARQARAASESARQRRTPRPGWPSQVLDADGG